MIILIKKEALSSKWLSVLRKKCLVDKKEKKPTNGYN